MIWKLNTWVFIAFIFCVITSCSRATETPDIGCLDGNIVTKEFTNSSGKTKRFSYSSDCEPSSKIVRDQDEKNSSYIVVEVQIPAATLTDNHEKDAKQQSIAAKGHLRLSPGPTPVMIESLSDTLRKKSSFSKDYLNYKIYKRTVNGVVFEPIFHRNNNEFYIECTDSFCMIAGIDAHHQVHYDLHIFDSNFRDWELIHELVSEFIEGSYHHDDHK